ncbi:hypothetical protein HQ544_04490 [Candidatus Falkowbacteria bacterium]|nr:hypothetical protein [Candidatus Falkowbacteria bacterium]
MKIIKIKIRKKTRKRIERIAKLVLIVAVFSSAINIGLFAYAKQITKNSEMINELTSSKVAQINAEANAQKSAQIANQERSQRVVAESNTQKAQQATKQIVIEKEAKEAELAQVETEKKAKEEELKQKDEQEKTMLADKDNDGLTYREELVLGTSDYTSDSDGDGIADSLDSNPAGGGRLIVQHFEWTYGYTDYTWDLSIHSDWYDYYKNKSRVNHGSEYVTYNDNYIIEIARQLKQEADLNGYSEANFAAAFVQGLAYVDDENIGYDDYPKYPIETIVERNGDCEDSSYLAAAIVRAMNIDVVLIELPGHMAIGVWMDSDYAGSYYENNNRNYYYLETTGSGWYLGEMPVEYKNKSAYIIDI